MTLSLYLCSDKQQEVDINNLRLGEEAEAAAAGRISGSGKGVGSGRSSGKTVQPPLSQISGVKKPLGHTNSFRQLI